MGASAQSERNRVSRPPVDLFGEPVPANWGQRGRPEHIPSQHNRHRVTMMIALGWSNERIAATLYITVPTLRKHYTSELRFRDVARDRLKATMATKLWYLFMSGNNVAACKEFRSLVEQNDLMRYGMPKKPRQQKPLRLGKKEAAARAAHNPDTGTPLGELMARRQGIMN